MSADAPSVSVRSYGLPGRTGLLALYLPIIALLFLVAVAATFPHIALSSLTRDMAAIAHVHPLIGVVSNVGVLLGGSAVICLFSYSLLRQRGLHAEARSCMGRDDRRVLLAISS